MRTLMLTALLLPACKGAWGDWGVSKDDLLETARVDGVLDEAVALEGEAAVEAVDAANGDYTFTFPEDQQVSVHSPGRLDLSALDGRELSGEAAWWGLETIQLSLSDDQGLVYAVAYQDPAGFAAGTFSPGGEVGQQDFGSPRYTYRALKVAADGGAVELEPGESAFVEIEGQTWQVVHHGTYEIEYSGAQPACGSDDVMAFEVLRVDEAGEDTILARPDGEGPLSNDLSCG